jgi:hypothetical protein
MDLVPRIAGYRLRYTGGFWSSPENPPAWRAAGQQGLIRRRSAREGTGAWARARPPAKFSPGAVAIITACSSVIDLLYLLMHRIASAFA